MPPKQLSTSLSDDAHADADAVTDWYIGEGALDAAGDFANELDRVLGLLSQFAEMGTTGAHNTRRLPLHSFPYSLIYRLQGNAIRVIAVAHHSRRPGFWVGRR